VSNLFLKNVFFGGRLFCMTSNDNMGASGTFLAYDLSQMNDLRNVKYDTDMDHEHIYKLYMKNNFHILKITDMVMGQNVHRATVK
jgi:hypothetical protein